MAQITLNSTGVASNGSLVLQSNGTTAAVTIDTSQRAAFVAGTAALPAITTTGDTNTGIFFPAADTIAFSEGGVESMRVNSSGVLTTTNDATIQGLTVGKGAGAGSANTALGVNALTSAAGSNFNTALGYQSGYSTSTGNGANSFVGYQSGYAVTTGESNTFLGTNSAKATTTGAFNVAIGKDSLQANTTASNNTAVGYQAGYSNTTGTPNTAVGAFALYYNTTGANNSVVGYNALSSNTTGGANTAMGREALSSNTTASNNTAVGYQAGYSQTTPAGGNTYIGYSVGYSVTTGEGNVFVGGNNSGGVNPAGYAVTTGSRNNFFGQGAGGLVTTGSKNTIIGNYNGNQGGLDIRTASNYIVLSDGDGNPRGIFDNSGNLLVGKASTSFGTAGISLRPASDSFFTTDGGNVIAVNRLTNDGNLVEFAQASTIEGVISVSGTTVTYGGGHLARFGQLPDGSEDPTLLKGTVLTNLDEMCVWINKETGIPADNEQCNKVKISDVDGDANVAGVFVSWSYDEQHDTNDLFVAMTGDMIIRIAQGVTVARGDLLMSAGDGTAKPQGDDIVRSKTVAKVTSTHVTCTYADGSYCVPCVLMAC